MLTRDIDLVDAIMDLVDNCLDGVLRTSREPDYSLYSSSLTLSATAFQIEDNCGGIERETAIKYAFKMGREAEDDRDESIETIGMYGIGMKRALFKLGRDSTIRTRHGDDQYKIRISPAWLASREWDPLPLEALAAAEQLHRPGTVISVQSLTEATSTQLGSSEFEERLRSSLGEHFSVFIRRGFTISVNERRVQPSTVEILVPEAEAGRPFYCRDRVDNVDITVAVGVNARIHREISDDEQDPTTIRRTSLPESGWTVYCNDRAVLVGDVSRLTGWGSRVPLFHPQFAILTGMVEFRARDARDLPVTTTKRALDTASPAWLAARDIMGDAMREFVTYTNAWKNEGREAHQLHYLGAQPADLQDVKRLMDPLATSRLPRRPDSAAFDPAKHRALPMPAQKTPSNRRIIFSRPRSEVRFLAERLLDDQDARPGAVGEACFDRALEQEGYE
jgi:hypothetical protein